MAMEDLLLVFYDHRCAMYTNVDREEEREVFYLTESERA